MVYFRDQTSYQAGVDAEKSRIRNAIDGPRWNGPPILFPVIEGMLVALAVWIYTSSEKGFGFYFTHSDGTRTLVGGLHWDPVLGLLASLTVFFLWVFLFGIPLLGSAVSATVSCAWALGIFQATNTVGWAVVAFIISVATHLPMLKPAVTRVILEFAAFLIGICIFLWPIGGLTEFKQELQHTTCLRQWQQDHDPAAYNRCVDGTNLPRAPVPRQSSQLNSTATPSALTPSKSDRARRDYDKCIYENSQRALKEAHAGKPVTPGSRTDCLRASGYDPRPLNQE